MVSIGRKRSKSETHARQSRQTYDYTAHGEGTEFARRRNREAFGWVHLVPRGSVDLSSVQAATEVLGTKRAYPIMPSPTSGHALIHKDAEAGTHQGTTQASNTPCIVAEINKNHFRGRQMVTCWTCHRNRDKPLVTLKMAVMYRPPDVEPDDVSLNSPVCPLPSRFWIDIFRLPEEPSGWLL